MDIFLHISDIPVILAIIAGVLIPELIRGFGRNKTLLRLGILTLCCVGATALAYSLQHADPGATFTRAFLIGITARINLVLNHATEATIAMQQKLQESQKEVA